MRTLPHVPIFQNAYKSYRVSFFVEKVKMSTVRLRLGVGLCRAIAHTVFVQYKNH